MNKTLIKFYKETCCLSNCSCCCKSCNCDAVVAADCCCAALRTPESWDSSSAIGSILSRADEKVAIPLEFIEFELDILAANCCAALLDLGGGIFRTGANMRRIFRLSGSSYKWNTKYKLQIKYSCSCYFAKWLIKTVFFFSRANKSSASAFLISSIHFNFLNTVT